MNRSRTLLLFGLTVTISAGCADDVTEPPRDASVQITQGIAVEAVPGDTLRLSASVVDGQGQPVPGAVVRWTTADAMVASVDDVGQLTAVAAGTTTVTAAAAFGASADVTVTVGPIRKVNDRTALTALYEATGGPDWRESDGWLTDAPLEDWHGVDTDNNGRVIRLELSSNRLTGEIPPELGDLASLRDLVIAHSIDLTGEIPPDLGNLTNLERLSLYVTGLTGEIPPELGNLASLEALGLSNNELTGEIPPELGDLPNLEALLLSDNGLTGEIPPELGDLANLERLRLSNNELTGEIPPELGDLANLEGLDLSDNGLTGEIPPELGSLYNLNNLHITDSDGLTGEIPPELGNLYNLRILDLSFSGLTGVIPAALGSLKLWIFRWEGNADLCAPGTRRFIEFAAAAGRRASGPFCHETDAAVLRSLYDLAGGSSWTSSDGWLQAGPLSDWHGVETDVAGRVAVLNLSGNGLSGALPGSLSSLEALRELRVDDNSELGGRVPLGMTALPLLVLRYDDTSLCAPVEPSFRSWLRSIASHTGNGVECPPLTDRDVLEALYYAVGGPNWKAKHNWLTESPLENWHGVATDENERVTTLNLNYNGLTGGIPPELGALTSLQILNLGSNGLTGMIPAELGNLVNLTLLNLWYNARTGGLTGAIPAELGNLVNLRELFLRNNDLTGAIPPELGNLASLEGLYLDNNDLTGVIPPELGNLANLERLYLSGNELTGAIPPELGNLANLTLLRLSYNGLTGAIPPRLGNLASLKTLWLYSNDLTGAIPSELGNLANLTFLDLSYNGLTGAIPPRLGNLASLTRLDLQYNGLTGEIPTDMGALASLEWLDLSHNGLTGEIPTDMGALASLDLSHNAGLSGALPAAWTSLDMSRLLLGGTGLCAPRDDAFQLWLRSILFRHVASCVERTGGEAVAAAYVVQAVQSFEFPVPLMAGRPGVLRVFASVPQSGGARVPAARATFYQRDGSEQTLDVPSGNGVLSADLTEGSLVGSANVEVPGDMLRPGVEMVVEVDPGNDLDPGLGVPSRIPLTGRTALDVYELPSFDVTVVPFLWENDPDSSILDVTRGLSPESSLFETTRRALPVGPMSVTVHEPVWTSSNHAFHLLGETAAIQTIESGSGYWMGTMPEPAGVVAAGAIAGVAIQPGRVQFSVPRSSVVAHEFGHNLHLSHAPCGGAGSPDPAYPDRRGRIGAWGWDHRSGGLVPPTRRDLMTYCGIEWVGNYHFAKSFRWRMHHEAGVAAFAGPPTRVLLLWGGAYADGKPFLNPAFVLHDARASLPDGTGEWRIVGEANDGRALFDHWFDMAEIADGDGQSSFVFTLPAEAGWGGALGRIVLTGPEGSAVLDAESGTAAALLLDVSTGRVRGILRNWAESAATQLDAVRAGPEGGLEVQVSRGVPTPDGWRR